MGRLWKPWSNRRSRLSKEKESFTVMSYEKVNDMFVAGSDVSLSSCPGFVSGGFLER